MEHTRCSLKWKKCKPIQRKVIKKHIRRSLEMAISPDFSPVEKNLLLGNGDSRQEKKEEDWPVTGSMRGRGCTRGVHGSLRDHRGRPQLIAARSHLIRPLQTSLSLLLSLVEPPIPPLHPPPPPPPPLFNPPPSRFPPPHPPYQHIRPLSTYFPGVRYSSRNSFELHISLAHREITPGDLCKLAM